MGKNLDLCSMLGLPETVTCPKCHKPTRPPFDDYDVEGANPSPGIWSLHVCCRECGHEWKYELHVRVSQTSPDDYCDICHKPYIAGYAAWGMRSSRLHCPTCLSKVQHR